MIQLTAKWTADELAVHVEYELTNLSAVPVYCLTHLFREMRSGARQIDPTLAFVRIRDACLICELLAPPVPEDIDVEYPIIPYAVMLKPAMRAQGFLRVPTPLTSHQPYLRQPATAMPDKTRSAVLQVGYVVASDDLAAKVLNHEGQVLFSLRPTAIGLQKVTSTGPIKLVVAVARS